MKKLIGILLWAAAVAAPAFAQTAALLPQPVAQFFDNNGIPLAGGLVYTYASGTATPLTTYTDATGGTANPNPVVLDSAGRANIWLLNQPYRIVVKNSSGVTITTTDGVLAGGFTNTGVWAVNGSTVYNATSGTKVCIGATPCTTALAQLNVTGASSGTNYLFRIDDSAGSPGINLYASGNSVGSYSGDSGGLRLRAAGGSPQVTVSQGNVTIQDTSSAGSTAINIQAGAAQGTTSLLNVKNSTGTTLAYIDPSGNGFFNGVEATGSNQNQIQAPYGGVTAKWLIGTDSLFLLEEAAPALSASGQARIYADSSSHTLLVSQNGGPYGPLSSGGGGGSGSPGGSNTQVQYNNAGAFAGSPNFIWNNAGQLLTVTASSSSTAGIAVGTGYMQADAGFLATAGTATNYNSVQAPGGGMAAKSFTATKYIQVGNSSGAPSATTGDAFHAGAMYWDTGSAAMQVYNGSAWVSLGGGAGSPGGADTNVQFNSTGSFAGSSNFTWSNSGQLLTVTAKNSSSAGIVVASGFMQSDAGFLATVGTATAYNAIQAPGGGMAAKSFTATKYIQPGFGATDPTVTTSDTFNPGAMYWNTASGLLKVYNGSSWVALSGSGGSPGGADTNVQFNTSGNFGGSSNLTWNNSSRLLTVTALSSGNPGILVSGGYVQADAGFLATGSTAVNYNAIQAPSGGVYARSFHALSYTQVGASTGAPSATYGDSIQAGAVYFNTALGALQVFNGSTWTSLSGGGGGGVTSVAGTSNQVYVNGGTGAQAGAVTLSLPQAISTSSNVQFNQVVTTGIINDVVTGANLAIQAGNGNFQVYGNGNVNGANLNALSSLQINGNTVINASRQFVGTGVDVAGNGVSAGNYNVYGGYIGQSWTIAFSSPFTINGGGSYTQLIFKGGVLVSAQ